MVLGSVKNVFSQPSFRARAKAPTVRQDAMNSSSLSGATVKAIAIASTLAALTRPVDAQGYAIGTSLGNGTSPAAIIGIAAGIGGVIAIMGMCWISVHCCSRAKQFKAPTLPDVEMAQPQVAPHVSAQPQLVV